VASTGHGSRQGQGGLAWPPGHLRCRRARSGHGPAVPATSRPYDRPRLPGRARRHGRVAAQPDTNADPVDRARRARTFADRRPLHKCLRTVRRGPLVVAGTFSVWANAIHANPLAIGLGTLTRAGSGGRRTTAAADEPSPRLRCRSFSPREVGRTHRRPILDDQPSSEHAPTHTQGPARQSDCRHRAPVGPVPRRCCRSSAVPDLPRSVMI
jgi:hypothetical protein